MALLMLLMWVHEVWLHDFFQYRAAVLANDLCGHNGQFNRLHAQT
jgi:hypothetical protein